MGLENLHIKERKKIYFKVSGDISKVGRISTSLIKNNLALHTCADNSWLSVCEIRE